MDKNTEATPKKKKAKGPIRFEAVLPVMIVLGLSYAYFKFFFDANLRQGIELVGGMVHGAEVNVGSINTSFLGGSFELNGLQITDKEKPHRNIIQIGGIRFKFNWDALLRLKFVVDEASIRNIQALVPRKSPGYVRPPTPPDAKTGPSALEKVERKALDQAKKQYDDNMLGDIAAVLGGVDYKDQLKNIEGQLKASGRIKELEQELKEKEKQWQERLKAFPQAKEIEDLGIRLKVLKFDTKNPSEFAKAVKEAEKIIKEADDKVKFVKETGDKLKGDVDNYEKAFKDLEKMVEQDLKDLQQRFKIPDLDGKDFSKKLFTQMIYEKVGSYYKYVAVAREYMPPKKTAEEKAAEHLIPPARGKGRNYRFPITTGYPLFWLRHASINSEVSQSEYSGNIEGRILDLNTDPAFLGKPTILSVKGDFPKQQVAGLNLDVTIDHTGDIAKEKLDLSIASYPVDGKTLTDSKDVRLAISEAKGKLAMQGSLEQSILSLKLNNEFEQVKFDVSAKNKIVQDILLGVTGALPDVTVNASATGEWDNLDLHLNSNLGDELSKGFKRELEAKIAEAKKQIKALIDDKIGAEKQKLMAEFDKIKSEVTGEIDKKKAEIDGAKKTAEAQVKQEQNKAKSGANEKLKKEGKKALEDLKKKFKIGK